jgi:hypothetical protein
MFAYDLLLPSAPPNTKRETNLETLRRLSRDLALINEGELFALDAYCLVVRKTEDGKSSWGYCCEAALEDNTNEIFVLIRTDETDTVERALYWIPISQLQTRKHAQLFCDIAYEGPTEEVMRAILYLIRDAFEFAADTNWSYRKRLEFFHSFPFEELLTLEAVHKFRPVLFGCPAFTQSIDIDISPPKSE